MNSRRRPPDLRLLEAISAALVVAAFRAGIPA